MTRHSHLTHICLKIPTNGCNSNGCNFKIPNAIPPQAQPAPQPQQVQLMDIQHNPFLNGQAFASPAKPQVNPFVSSSSNQFLHSSSSGSQASSQASASAGATSSAPSPFGGQMNLNANPFLNGQISPINNLQHRNSFSSDGQVIDQGFNGFLGVQPKPFSPSYPGNRCTVAGQVCVPVELCVNGYVSGDALIGNRLKVSDRIRPLCGSIATIHNFYFGTPLI